MFQPKLTENPPEGEASTDNGHPTPEVQSGSRPYALHEAGTPQPKPMVRAVPSRPIHAVRSQHAPTFHPKVPVITGEATYRGLLRVDGAISGQLGGNGGAVMLKQRPRTGSEAELDGEITFKDMLRVNGHVAGKLLSEKGTLIVDVEALVNADIDVAVAIIDGTVNGNVVAHERLELGLRARINGNIWTRSLKIKPGAIFEGECKILRDQENTGTA
jgi:cytoskeletal protein CcmA (bactofilin family)